ncbi:MAG: isochorismatase family protein [Methylocystis sp.]|uniref:isochorismatase family protein n=1 Tax=Methylocystis sp. TaxID=1911079 RepID=UPI003D0A785E
MAIQSLASYAMPSADSFRINKVGWSLAPERAALLIHDMQDYFVGFYGAESPLVDQLVSNIRKLRAFFKAHGAPVIYTAQPIEQSDQDRGLLNDMWGPGLNAHPDLHKIVAPLAPEADDIVLTKWRYSAFKRSTLAEMMKDMGRDQLAICGVYGHIGCLTTALDAFMQDIKPFVIADAIGDFSREDHLMTLNYVAGRCGMAIGVEDVLAAGKGHAALLTREDIKKQLLSALEVEEAEFDADENLIDYGLDSVQVMMLVTEWRRRGVDVGFEELAKNPTLNGWWEIIDRRLSADVAA